MKMSEEGFKYFLTMIDHYTKIAKVAPFYTKDMSSTLSLINKLISRKHGETEGYTIR